MRWMIVLLGLASMVSAGSSLALVPGTLRTPVRSPGEAGTFLIPPNDGYGVAECLASKNDCGKVVADGYCQANGYVGALTFGPISREDITGSIVDQRADTLGMVLSITCHN